jgi:hypothetical protein
MNAITRLFFAVVMTIFAVALVQANWDGEQRTLASGESENNCATENSNHVELSITGTAGESFTVNTYPNVTEASKTVGMAIHYPALGCTVDDNTCKGGDDVSGSDACESATSSTCKNTGVVEELDKLCIQLTCTTSAGCTFTSVTGNFAVSPASRVTSFAAVAAALLITFSLA